MEFPGKCLTNIQKIENCSSIPYQVYRLSQTSSEANDGSPISHPPTPPSGLLSVRHSTLYLQTELQRIETALRSESILTATKVSNLEVWIFGNGHQLGAVGETLASAEKEVEYLGNERNLKLHKIRSVSLMSSSLPKRDTSVALGIIGSIPSVSPSTLESNFRASQTGNIKAAQMTAPLMVHTPDASMNQSAETAYNPQGQEDDVVDSYGILMSAVIAAITFKLVKSFGYIPLNFRTLVAPRSTVGAEDSDNQDNDNIGVRTRSPVVIETLDARLTTAGTLVVCHSSALQPALLQVDWKGPERGATPLEPGTTDVWLAPGGTIARYLGQSQVLDKELRNDNVITHDQREEQGHSFTDERDQRWMLDVRAWLKGWGLVSQDFENRASWVNVQIRMPAHIDPSRPQTSDDHDYLHTMLWPARLCFYKEKARIDKGQSSESSNVIGASPLPDPSAATKQLRPSTSWSSSLMDGGTHDPLAFAEEWFLGERSREDSRRVRKDTIEQLARSTHPPTTNNLIDNPSGLTNLSRNMNYTDVQAANTIYPTPPDGVQSQGGTGPSFPDVPGATPVDVIEQSGPNESIAEEDPSALPEMDFMGSLSNEDNDDGSAPRKHSDLADFGLGSGNIVASVDDDMFEELDEAMFGGHAVTDADFSFFDEPDLDMGGDGLTENVESTEASHNQEPNPDLTGGLENMLGLDFDNTDGGSKNRDFLESFDASVKLETAHGDQMTGLFDEELGEAIEGPNDLANTKPLRSSQAPESQDTHTAGPSNGSILSPPLSPVEVMKKLIPGLGLRKETAKSDQNGGRSLKSEDDDHSFTFKRRQSYFNPIAFNNTLDTSDHKYKADGRFWMRSHDRQQDSEICLWKIASSNALRIPKIGFPKRQRRVRIGVIEDKIGSDCDMQENRMNRSLSEEGAKSDIDGSESDSNSETEQSDQDDISEVTEVESFRSFPLGTKRKRNQSDEGEDRMSTSFERLAVDVDPDPGLLDESFLSLWETLAPNAADWSLAGYFSLPDDESVGVMRLDGKELISVAQIVADQTISATLQPYFGGTENIQEDVVKDVGRGTFAEAVKETFSKAIQCDLITFLTVEDIPPDPPILGKAPLRQGIRRGIAGTNASGVTNITSAELFKIHSPHVRVRRADTAMEVLPSALPFWETFGFGPCSGKKDVVAYCVYLPGQGTRDAADGFLERLGSVYESCRLGSHVRGESAAWSDEGLLPVKTPEAVPKDSSERMHDVKETCILLGRELSAISAEDQNIVIYLVNPYTHPSALVDLCAAFLSLCHAYAHSPDFQVSKNCEVVLQIIPIGFIASAASIIIPTQADYTKLALEVYERCAPGHQDTLPRSSPTQYTPSVALAQTPPKSIDFKLTSEPSPSLLQENSCLHIAYSQSLDDRWISAAWTDNLGNCQTSASYCLGTKHSSLRPFVEIAQEIWETTMEIIQARRVTWRLLFAKSGVMNHEEIDTWATLANQPSVVSIVLTLLTTSPTSSLTLHVTMPTLSSATFNPQAGSYTTPVSTPQPSTLSPDQFGNAASTPSNTNTNNTNAGTPNADVSTLEVDPDASLVDVTDETWGAILSHRMQNTHSVLEYQPALASGYLIKRTGSREEDPPITFAVNLIYTTPLVPPPGHGQGPPGQRSAVMGSGMNAGNHALLKEVLGLYRGLGNLARAKGVVDRFKGIEPWHVAASRKAAAVLGWLM